MEQWAISEIGRRRVPLLVLWAEQKVWLAKLDEQERLFHCSDCHAKFTPAPDLCVFCFQPICANCYQAHDKRHWQPVRTIGGEVIAKPPKRGRK